MSHVGNDLLDVTASVTRRAASWRFELVDRFFDNPRTLLVDRDQPPSIRTDTSRAIKRTLEGLRLLPGVIDEVDLIKDRLLVWMVLEDGTEWPQGAFLFTDAIRGRLTSGVDIGALSLADQNLIVDQQASTTITVRPGQRITSAIETQLGLFPIRYQLTSSGTVVSTEQEALTWAAGTSRLRVINELAAMIGYHELYFDNDGVAQMHPMPDPDATSPDKVLSHPQGIYLGSLTQSSNLLDLPNRFTVVNNGASQTAIYGIYDLPASAPHSAANLGYIRTHVEMMQGIDTPQQAKAAARALARSYRFADETLEFSTAPDPRHDHYNVMEIDDIRYLEINWSLTCAEGSDHRHTVRRTYGEDEETVGT